MKYIFKGPTRKQCHVTANSHYWQKITNLDPEVFCCKIWSKIVCYVNKHEIWTKYGILSHWRHHTKITKTPKGVFAVLSFNWRYPVCDFFWLNHWMKAGAKPNNMVLPILSVRCLNHFIRQLLWPQNTNNIATLFIERPQIWASSTECGMIAFADCSHSLLTLGTNCHKWLNCLFVRVLYWLAALHQLPCFHNHLAKNPDYLGSFLWFK